MKASQTLHFSFLFLFLFLFHNALCQKDFKDKFRDEFGDTVKGYVIELFQIDIVQLKEFYENILKEVTLNAEETADLKNRIQELNELKDTISKKDTATFVDILKSVAIDNVKKITGYSGNSDNLFSEEDFSKVKTLSKDLNVAVRAESAKFAMKIYDKWTEMYETIPKDEFAKHPEYEDIHKLMQELAATDGHGTVFLTIARNLVTFFGYNNWQFIIEIDDSMKN